MAGRDVFTVKEENAKYRRPLKSAFTSSRDQQTEKGLAFYLAKRFLSSSCGVWFPKVESWHQSLLNPRT